MTDEIRRAHRDVTLAELDEMGRRLRHQENTVRKIDAIPDKLEALHRRLDDLFTELNRTNDRIDKMVAVYKQLKNGGENGKGTVNE